MVGMADAGPRKRARTTKVGHAGKSMQSGECRRAGAGGVAVGYYWAPRLGTAVVVLAVCLAAGGCGTVAPLLSPLAQNRDISVAVESIDGPPREVSQRLISDLNAEGAPLKIAVVASEANAAYRMRGYLATHAAGSTTAITWAWDVYDSGLNRAFRLTGEERVAAKEGPKSWAVADEAVLRRIAHAGMDQLAGFMASPPAPAVPTPGPAAPLPSGTDTVASRDDAPAEPGASAFTGTPRLAEAGRR